jgi:frataxin-like iron-binding protein CyaY
MRNIKSPSLAHDLILTSKSGGVPRFQYVSGDWIMDRITSNSGFDPTSRVRTTAVAAGA